MKISYEAFAYNKVNALRKINIYLCEGSAFL